ncbi:NADH dehydrogenase [ubiquinone] 1 alpha subcomplex subunit 9, mitochondrial, partial [Galemys pyrenaicus]
MSCSSIAAITTSVFHGPPIATLHELVLLGKSGCSSGSGITIFLEWNGRNKDSSIQLWSTALWMVIKLIGHQKSLQERLKSQYFGNIHWFGCVPFISLSLKRVKQSSICCTCIQGLVNAFEEPDARRKPFACLGPNRYLLFELVQYGFAVVHRPFIPFPLPYFSFQFNKHDLTRDRVEQIYITDKTCPHCSGFQPMPLELKAMEVLWHLSD